MSNAIWLTCNYPGWVQYLRYDTLDHPSGWFGPNGEVRNGSNFRTFTPLAVALKEESLSMCDEPDFAKPEVPDSVIKRVGNMRIGPFFLDDDHEWIESANDERLCRAGMEDVFEVEIHPETPYYLKVSHEEFTASVSVRYESVVDDYASGVRVGGSSISLTRSVKEWIAAHLDAGIVYYIALES